jgi:hypothetical protein
MFPESFVLDHLLAYSLPGDLVMDPFAGRGTTLFESLLHGRQAIGTDVNRVAVCISGAKVDPPLMEQVIGRIDDLEMAFRKSRGKPAFPSQFFEACYHRDTFHQIWFLRGALSWRRSKVDRFVCALMLAALHGESHRSEICLSNRMPRTISTKPEYSIRWWSKHNYVPPRRDTFEVLRRAAIQRFTVPPAQLRGQVRLADARTAAQLFPWAKRQVRLVITSPPYIDMTDYAEDQWLRLWFLGGQPWPKARLNSDDRHYGQETYWRFLSEVWTGIAPLLSRGTTLVVRIGGNLRVDELRDGLKRSLEVGFARARFKPRLLHCTSSDIRRRQTNVFRPGTQDKNRREHDLVFRMY